MLFSGPFPDSGSGGHIHQINLTPTDLTTLRGGGSATLAEIQSSLAPGTTLIEYYQARGRFYACVVDRQGLEIVPLAPAARIHSLFRLLQFQLSKFRLQPDYTRAFANELQGATEAHLFDLYSELVAPIRARLRGKHLVVVPHDVLHCLPFHALWDGERFLIEDFTVSYAPSASVYRLCCIKPPVAHQTSLVMGVPTESMPHVAEEIQEVAATLPSPVVFVGSEATSERQLDWAAQPVHPHRELDVLAHGADVHQRLIGIAAAQDAADPGRQSGRLRVRQHREGHHLVGVLVVGNIDFLQGLLGVLDVLQHVAAHADHADPAQRIRVARHLEVLAERALLRPDLFHKGFAHHRDALRLRRVEPVEVTARLGRNAEHSEVAGEDDAAFN